MVNKLNGDNEKPDGDEEQTNENEEGDGLTEAVQLNVRTKINNW